MNDLSNKPGKISKLVTTKPVHILYTKPQHNYLRFDERYLYEHWHNRFSSGDRFHLLHDLSPKLACWTHISESSLHALKWGAVLLLAAGVVFFSDYHARVPLLAPSLFLAGLVPALRGLIGILPKTWTYIYDDEGNYIASIPVPKNESALQRQQREAFERQLSTAIETAKQKEYYELE